MQRPLPPPPPSLPTNSRQCWRWATHSICHSPAQCLEAGSSRRRAQPSGTASICPPPSCLAWLTSPHAGVGGHCVNWTSSAQAGDRRLKETDRLLKLFFPFFAFFFFLLASFCKQLFEHPFRSFSRGCQSNSQRGFGVLLPFYSL